MKVQMKVTRGKRSSSDTIELPDLSDAMLTAASLRVVQLFTDLFYNLEKQCSETKEDIAEIPSPSADSGSPESPSPSSSSSG